MDGVGLQDRVSRGMGVAARVLGGPYDLMRPDGAAMPVRPELRVLRMPAAFDGGDPGYRRPRGYERALRGIFDSAYVAAGDFLVGARGVLFVAWLPPLARPLCVLTNAVVDVVRPVGPGVAGLNSYGGVGLGGFEAVLTGWPAQVFAGGRIRPGGLPGDGGLGEFTVVLPVLPVGVRGSDVVVDQAGRRFVVGAVDESELGWVLGVRMVGA